MDRRELLCLLGLSVTGLAGCAGGDADRGEPPTRPQQAVPTSDPGTPTPTPTPTPSPTPERFVDDLRTTLVDARVTESADGHPKAIVPVANTASEPRDATLAVTIAGGGERYTASTAISVPADATREYTVTFDVDWATVAAGDEPVLRELFLYNPEYRS